MLARYLLVPLLLLAMPAVAAEPLESIPPIERRIPPAGIEVPAAELERLQQRLGELQQQLAKYQDHKLEADVAIYTKAAAWAL